MTKTIRFNTGRKYTAHGQRITATLHDDGIVTFYDHDRSVDGEFKLSSLELPISDADLQDEVRWHYDHGKAPNSQRSWQDAFQRGGCNTKYEG